VDSQAEHGKVASGDVWRRADVGTMEAAQLWERRRVRRRALSANEQGSGDGDDGAPVTMTVMLR
jgi:hypothetical protein